MASTPNWLLFFFLLFVILLNNLLCGRAEDNPEVQISLGKVMGSTMKTRLGKNIYAFRGIRYAKPPTGERRFMPPEPVDPWPDTYDATNQGPACPSFTGKNVSEDCLVLNIYCNELPSPGDKSPVKKPVIIFIHQGGFHSSSGQSAVFGPQYLLDQNVVLVTFNYRIGPLGFMSTGDKYALGNMGLKDQVLVLQFVKNHIEAFGGDPNLVTLTGQSAGARSVYLHMISPMSQGLFHHAIAMSGSPVTIESVPQHQKHLAIKQAEILECPTDDIEKMVECMRSKPAEDFGKSLPKFQEWHTDPILIWYPVIEPEIQGVERFLLGQPIDSFKSGQFHQVPLMTGIARDEMGPFVIESVEAAKNGDNSILKDLNDHWEQIAPISFMYERDSDRSKTISKELMKFYFNNQPITLENTVNRANIYADAITIYPVRRLSLLIVSVSSQPLYFYLFNYEGPYSIFTWSDKKPYGVAHQDDLFYLFYNEAFPMIQKNDPEASLVNKMTTMWANFAKIGEQFPKGHSPFTGLSWDRLTLENRAYMEINNTWSMKQVLLPERMKFWEGLYPA